MKITYKCPCCGGDDFECDYADESAGTYEQNSGYICLRCGAYVTIYEGGQEPCWEPPSTQTNQ